MRKPHIKGMSCLYPDYIEVINTNTDPHKEVSVLDTNIKI